MPRRKLVFRIAWTAPAMLLLFAVGAAVAPQVCPSPIELPGGAHIPPRPGVSGSVGPDAQDAAFFPAPTGPGQWTKVTFTVRAQFLDTGASPSVDYALHFLQGTVFPVTCSDPVIPLTTISSDGIGISAKEDVREYTFAYPPSNYYVPVAYVKTHGSAVASWNVAVEPCGYPCIKPFLPPELQPFLP